MRTPGFQEWWVLRKDWFGEDFQEFVSTGMPESTGALVEDFKRPVQVSQASAVAADSAASDRGSA